MPDQGKILSDVDEYADAVAAEKVAAQKATDDAAYAALQAEYDAYRASHPDAPPQIIEFADFADQNTGMYVPTGDLLGAGIDKTIYRMKPGSSSKASLVNALASHTTNQFKLIRASGTGAARRTSDVEYGGFTLEGTDQGHDYGGMVVGYSTRARVHDLRVTGIPGSASSPPGETFSLAMWHTDSHALDDVTLDGRNSEAAEVAATLLGYNYVSGDTVVNRLKANYSKYGFGAALFGQAGGTHTFNDCDFAHNRKAVNIEGNSGGTFVFNRCDFSDVTGAAYQMQVVSGTGPVTVRVVDPVCDGVFTVWVGAHQQVMPTVVLIVDGQDVSKDPAQLKIVSAG